MSSVAVSYLVNCRIFQSQRSIMADKMSNVYVAYIMIHEMLN